MARRGGRSVVRKPLEIGLRALVRAQCAIGWRGRDEIDEMIRGCSLHGPAGFAFHRIVAVATSGNDPHPHILGTADF